MHAQKVESTCNFSPLLLSPLLSTPPLRFAFLSFLPLLSLVFPLSCLYSPPLLSHLLTFSSHPTALLYHHLLSILFSSFVLLVLTKYCCIFAVVVISYVYVKIYAWKHLLLFLSYSLCL